MQIEFPKGGPRFVSWKMSEVNAPSGSVFTQKDYPDNYFIYLGEGEWIRVDASSGRAEQQAAIIWTLNLNDSEYDSDKFGDLEVTETDKKAKLVFY